MNAAAEYYRHFLARPADHTVDDWFSGIEEGKKSAKRYYNQCQAAYEAVQLLELGRVKRRELWTIYKLLKKRYWAAEHRRWDGGEGASLILQQSMGEAMDRARSYAMKVRQAEELWALVA
jgi:hypothetical protein